MGPSLRTDQEHGDAIDDCCHQRYEDAMAVTEQDSCQAKAHVHEAKDQPDSQQSCLSTLHGIQDVHHHGPNHANACIYGAP